MSEIKGKEMYVYIESEPSLFTVGFYDPNGNFHSDSDHGNRAEAAERVGFLNGTNSQKLARRIDHLEHQVSCISQRQATAEL